MAEPTLATQAEIAADHDLGDRRKQQLERRRRYAERLQNQGLLLILAGAIAIMWGSSPYVLSVDHLFTAAAAVGIPGLPPLPAAVAPLPRLTATQPWPGGERPERRR